MTQKYTISFIVTLLIFISTKSNAYNAVMLSCESCSLTQVEHLVKSQNTIQPLSEYYIIDFENEKLYRYYLHNDFERFRRFTSSAHLPTPVAIAESDFWQSRRNMNNDDFERDMRNSFVEVAGITSAQNGAIGNLELMQNVNSSSQNSCPNSQLIFDYITTSQTRTNAYYRLLSKPYGGGMIQALINDYNTLLSKTNAQVTSGVVSGRFPLITTTVYTEGAGRIGLRVRPGVPTMDVVDGTVFDCNGNEVPTDINNLPGNYLFATLSEAERFSNFAEFLGATIEVEAAVCVNLSFQTRCRLRLVGGKERYICTLIVPSCLQ